MKLRTDPMTAIMVIAVSGWLFLQSVWGTGKTCSQVCIWCDEQTIDCDMDTRQDGVPARNKTEVYIDDKLP